MKFRDYDNYEVYEDGRIWSYSHKKWLKPQTRKDGYQQVSLTDNNGKQKSYQLHRVVWEAVSGKPIPTSMQVNHIDENKLNNQKSNLNLMTPKDNTNWGSGIERRAKSRSKQVGAFKDDKLIFTFDSTAEARRNGFNQGHISECCNNCYNRPGNNVYRGYTWRFI